MQEQRPALMLEIGEHHDWHLTEEHIYRDNGYSGATLDRTTLDHLRHHPALAELERMLITA